MAVYRKLQESRDEWPPVKFSHFNLCTVQKMEDLLREEETSMLHLMLQDMQREQHSIDIELVSIDTSIHNTLLWFGEF